MKAMSAAPEVRNWEGSVVSHPAVMVYPENVDDLVTILTNPQQYPSPVRAVGSNHSTTRCGIADGGTLVVMTGMNRVIEIGPDYVTAEAGALYIDVAEKLREHNLQFYVNVELGNLSIGSAACGGTKDASMPGECGQVNSYVIGVKLVTPSGERLEITEAQPELLQMARSSYGLFGIIYEVTFRVKPLKPMSVWHENYSLEEFEQKLPQLIAQGASMMLYIAPFLNVITVEYRQYLESGETSKRQIWRLRNWFWKTVGPGVSATLTRFMPVKPVRYFLIDRFYHAVHLLLDWIAEDAHTIAEDQIIRYPHKGGWNKYTFSIWAFPEADYLRVLREYFEFCHDYYRRTGYRCDIINVGYRITKDTSSLFSYSYNGDVMTVDPVSTANPGWEDFLAAYNAFCSERGGVPLFNQTKHILPAQARRAFGERLQMFEAQRRQLDPDNRMLNAYFAEILADPILSS